MVRIPGLVVVGVALLLLCRLLMVSWEQLSMPYDLVFESPNLATIELLRTGGNPYAPAVYAAPPFVFTLYPPLYHHLVAVLPAHPRNPFLTGRLVSGIAMLAAAAGLFCVAGRRTPFSLALLGMGVFFGIWPVLMNTAYLKNDSLALLFSIATLLLAHHRRHASWMPLVCAALTLAAVVTKQSFVAGGVACAVFLLWVDRAQCVRFTLSCALLAGVFGGFAHWHWGPGFWFSTVQALRQDVTLDHALGVMGGAARQPLLMGLLLLGGLVTWRAVRRQGLDSLRASPWLAYVAASSAVFALTVGKLGSTTNYVIEASLALLSWIVFCLAPDWPGCLRRHPLLACVFALTCALEPLADPARYSLADRGTRDRMEAMFTVVRDDVAALGIREPLLLSPFTHRLAFGVTGRPTLSDPYLYGLLWRDGILDLASMIESVDAHVYDVVVIPENPRGYLGRPPRKLLRAIARNYRPARISTGFRYLVRREGERLR